LDRLVAFLAVMVVSLPSPALAPGGGLDACGGHHDGKRGGYHVHRMAQYCACHPWEQACKEYGKAPSKDNEAMPR